MSARLVSAETVAVSVKLRALVMEPGRSIYTADGPSCYAFLLVELAAEPRTPMNVSVLQRLASFLLNTWDQ